ncbi:MAG: ORF6N domain-containing protein [Bacteroidales bacterium]|nr:ORF6N domain-containing protein [Bacteroidales bacterium]
MPDNSLQTTNIENKILVIRGQQVMLDRDLAELYGVETKRLNEQVRRNTERFPEEFMFQLTRNELESVKSQIATLKNDSNESLRGKHSKYLPYAFTEQGCAMLSSVIRSETAIQVSIKIMDAFVAMRHFLQNNAQIFAELKSVRHHQIETDVQLNETNRRIDELFDRIDKYAIDDTQGIFFQGQICPTMVV